MYQLLKSKIVSLLETQKRLDGRKLDEYRQPIKVETGISPTAEGSARVRIGGTQVIAGVKMEIMQPYPDQPDTGSIMVGAELLPMSNPDFELGPPSAFAIELARVVDRGIRESKAIDFKKMCIVPGEKAWMAIIDICPINDEGNLFDAAALAALAAIKDATLPGVVNEKIDYKKKTKEKIPLMATPISVTVSKIGSSLIVDPITDEEKVVDARLTMAFIDDKTLCALQKGGDATLTLEEIETIVDLGRTKAKELRKALESAKPGNLTDE